MSAVGCETPVTTLGDLRKLAVEGTELMRLLLGPLGELSDDTPAQMIHDSILVEMPKEMVGRLAAGAGEAGRNVVAEEIITG